MLTITRWGVFAAPMLTRSDMIPSCSHSRHNTPRGRSVNACLRPEPVIRPNVLDNTFTDPPMKKVFVCILWIIVLNGAFACAYAAFRMEFNPTITHSEAYKFGNTYGGYFLLLSVGLIVYLAMTNRLPGAKSRRLV